MIGPRWFRKIWADVFGYFWLSCPRCGREFGGHEKFGPTIWDTDNLGHGMLTCRRCEGVE